MQFRPSLLKERSQFYKQEFSISKARGFLKFSPQYFAIDPGTETRIIKNKKDFNTIISLNPNINLQKLKQQLITNLPEDVYYDRNVYKDIKICERLLNKGKKPDYNKSNILCQELAFDLDSENITCSKCKNNSILKVCIPCLEEAKQQTVQLYKKLHNLNFKKLQIVYTGRGYHIHVFDKKAYSLSTEQRRRINKKLKDFAIDPWVSEGDVRLIRLPYTLNALVSRIATHLSIKNMKEFNPINKSIPRFLK